MDDIATTVHNEFITAEVKIRLNKDKLKKTQKQVSDAKEVAKLASFFPGLGKGEKSDIAAGYSPRALLTFERPDGRKVEVYTNYRFWTEGNGDWDVEDGLEDYLIQLLR